MTSDERLIRALVFVSGKSEQVIADWLKTKSHDEKLDIQCEPRVATALAILKSIELVDP